MKPKIALFRPWQITFHWPSETKSTALIITLSSSKIFNNTADIDSCLTKSAPFSYPPRQQKPDFIPQKPFFTGPHASVSQLGQTHSLCWLLVQKPGGHGSNQCARRRNLLESFPHCERNTSNISSSRLALDPGT